MPEFYMIIARKIFFPDFFFWGGGARAPCPPSSTPMNTGEQCRRLTMMSLTTRAPRTQIGN